MNTINFNCKEHQIVGDVIKQLTDGMLRDMANAEIQGAGSILSDDELNKMRTEVDDDDTTG